MAEPKESTLENWEDEFENRFIKKDRAGRRYSLSRFMNDLSVAYDVKTFIRRLIEQARPTVSREFVEKWADKLYELEEYGYINLLIAMFTELGYEVEGEEGK
jgi:hypothetical protein